MTQRFFIADNLEDKKNLSLPKGVGRQLNSVLRVKNGEKIILFDGSGYGFISEYDGKSGVKILERLLNRCEADRKIYLFQSLLKKDKMEWVFEKGTEVGVFEFFPVLSERSIKKAFNKERGEKIIKEAVEQSGRSILPKINEILTFKKALEFVHEARMSGVIADINSKKHISETLKDQAMALFIGPEGGWSAKEISEAKESGFKAVNLGRITLRAETAAIVGSAFLVS